MADPGKIDGFGGMAPRIAARQLQPTQSQLAFNARLTSGELEPLNAPLLLASLLGLTAPAQSVFKSITDTETRWLAWPTQVDAVRALVAGDRTGRVYYTGDGAPQWTTYALAGRDGYPMASRVLGLHAPTAAPTVTHTGASGDVANRAFLYSFAAADGTQESQASPAVVVTGRVAGTWDVSGLAQPPANNYATSSHTWVGGTCTVVTPTTYGLRVGDVLLNGAVGKIVVTGVTPTTFSFDAPTVTITGGFARAVPHDTTGMKWRIYWSEADGSYKLMSEVPVTTALPITINAAAIGTTVEPLLDAPLPPVDLRSLCRHSSGALFGISGNELCASEPYKPYAWPAAYRAPLASDPTACRAFGNVIVVGTAGTPEVFIGADPSTMQPEDVRSVWPCLSSRGMVSFSTGVAFPTTFGLAWIGTGAPQILTEASYTERKWRAVAPSTLVAAPYGNAYVGVYQGETAPEMWIFRPGEPAPVSLGSATGVTALYTDPQDGTLIMVGGDQVYRFDADEGRRLIYSWTSKRFELEAPYNIAAFRVGVDFSTTQEERAAAGAAREAVLEANIAATASGAVRAAMASGVIGLHALGASTLRSIPPDTFDRLGVTVIVNEQVVYSERIMDSGTHKLPAGYKEDDITWVISGNVTVSEFEFARSATALRRS